MSRITRSHPGADLPQPPPVGPGRGSTRAARVVAGPLVAGLLATGLLAGCGNPIPTPTGWAEPSTLPNPAAPNPAAPSSAAAAVTPDPDPGASPTGDAPVPAEPVRLPWPAADATAAAELQRSVDGGSEPWLLDPAEVAVSYATAAHGWTRAEAQSRPGGTTVDVSDGSRRLTLSLTQPGRAGAGGIWVVTAESAG